ncbi:hypothetical protein LOC67_16000 [Stieleria sp. JC731]|uniref:hypothetical protein n=1 Tax=Pirellulaceae TaxID=2691357 RepID=UPI001E3CD6B1|nr:hypothetical protein [Stieleria sp. JC731]MCC9602066.1 hypothetical protein [Stieleria sp. JC731]
MRQIRNARQLFTSVVRTRQTFPTRLSAKLRPRFFTLRSASQLPIVVLFLLLGNLSAWGEFYDRLDAFPPRWQLDTSDCDARVIEQKVLPASGFDGNGCETLTFQAALGSEAVITYRIEPVHAIDDLNANLYVLSARRGARVGFRVRFPYVRDPETRRPLATVLYGATYERPGKFQQLGVGNIESDLRVRIAKLRRQLGTEANLSDPYIDAVAINAYSGPGLTTLRFDDISINGMVNVGDHGRVENVPPAESVGQTESKAMRPFKSYSMLSSNGLVGTADEVTIDSLQANSLALPAPFPRSSIIRILEHRGEPLAWVRSLGFDAVLLSRPPTAEVLREAIRTGLMIYSPPPMAPDPELQTLLDPVMAWYLGGGVALDQKRIEQTDRTVTRLRSFPSVWQRPIVIAPVESLNQYASLADAIVYDAALRSRGLTSDDQVQSYWNACSRIVDRIDVAVSIESSAPQRLHEMNAAIAEKTGAPADGLFRWHSMLTQVTHLLEHSPSAIVFHSHASLTSGKPTAHQRSSALSYVNRFIAMMAPWMAWADRSVPFPVTGAAYHCGVLRTDQAHVLLLSSDAGVRDQILAGDGSAVQIRLPPEMAKYTAWRMTDFAAERIPIQTNAGITQLQIVSPDVAEIIVISPDAKLGTDLDRSARQFAKRAASDRWQLSGEQVRHAQIDWQNAVSSGATEAIMPVALVNAAVDTHARAEDAYRSNDFINALRLSRRADAWATRANIQLGQSLVPIADQDDVRYLSVPPLDEGNLALQAVWRPLMDDKGWSNNLIALGGLDQANAIGPENWSFGQRKINRAASDIAWISRGFFSGAGALRLSASSTTSEPLGGGYAGTIAMLSSPAVNIEPNQTIRIDVMVRTLGFGQPHQGLLVYDSIGGQEMGILVNGADQWKRVRLYRQSTDEREIKAMFEIIGDGEAVIDEVSIQVWRPGPLANLPQVERR